MPLVPYNSVGGFSTGLTLTNVIDPIGNITGVGATFSGLIRANAGISASGATFSGNISAPNIVNSFNGSTGAVQGVSAAVGSTYLTVSGSTGSVTFTNTGVQTFNGLTGAVTGVTVGGANIFTALNSFNAGISASGGTFSGDIAVNGGDITTTSATATIFNTTATTLNLGGAATTWTVGATGSESIGTIRNPTLVLGDLTNTSTSSIITPTGTGSHLNIIPYGNLSILPTTSAGSIGTFPALTVTNGYAATGQVQISGGDVYLGTKSVDGEISTGVNIIFEGDNEPNKTTLTAGDPTADRTITLPNASGTVALTSGLVSSLSGSTYISVSGSTGAVTITNTGVQTFNGLTGAVTGVTVGGTNVFTALNTFNAGISAAGGVTFANDISVDLIKIGRGAGGYTYSVANVAIGNGYDGPNLQFNTTGEQNTAIGYDVLPYNTTGNYNVGVGTSALEGNDSGSNNTAVGNSTLIVGTGSENTAVGAGALSYASDNQNTAIGYQAGSYRGTGSSTRTSGTGGIFIGYRARASGNARTNEIVIGTNALGLGSNTAVIGATAQTAATIYGLMNLPGGLSAAGITVGGSIVLQNQEFIRNTTNGRMDFMPAPAGSTQYGMYMDFTSWSYGVKLGTIRASDNATNAAGFLWEAPLNINGDVALNLGSNSQNGIELSSTGNDTIQFFTSTTSGTNSGAIAIVDADGQGTANRSPGVTHTNPNLYVYRSGSARANDFVRMEHDGTVGRIVSGGTSGISLEPGSGVLGISGGISAAGGTFTNNVQANGYILTSNARSWFL